MARARVQDARIEVRALEADYRRLDDTGEDPHIEAFYAWAAKRAQARGDTVELAFIVQSFRKWLELDAAVDGRVYRGTSEADDLLGLTLRLLGQPVALNAKAASGETLTALQSAA